MEAHVSVEERQGWKLDATGEYRRFCGLTFVSMLRPAGSADAEAWRTVLAALETDATIARHYRALPLASMHVTVKNHETAAHSAPPHEPDRWFESVLLDVMRPRSRLRSMMGACARHAYTPHAWLALRPWTHADSTLRVEVTLTPDPQPLRDDLERLGSRPEPGFVFHMTLAYRFRLASSQAERDELDHALSTAMRALTFVKQPLTLDTCALHYFPSMCEFVPLMLQQEDE